MFPCTDSEAPILAHIIDHNRNTQPMVWRLKDMFEKRCLATTLLCAQPDVMSVLREILTRNPERSVTGICLVGFSLASC